MSKDRELRRLSSYLYEHDTLSAEEMDVVIKGKGLGKEKEDKKVRTVDPSMLTKPSISFA